MNVENDFASSPLCCNHMNDALCGDPKALPGDIDGVILLGGFIHDDLNNSPYAERHFAGALDQGFWRARLKDTMGLLFSHNAVSGRPGKVQTRKAELGIPLSSSATGVSVTR